MGTVRWLAIVALLTGCAVVAPAQRPGRPSRGVAIERVAYHGWSGAWRISNRVAELIFVPQIGRIMRYGLVGGPNLLWENPATWGKVVDPADATDWTNFGGDKLWIAPQWQWRGDQDPYLDAGACKVTVLPGTRLRVAGPTSPNYGLRFVRVISMSPRGAAVTIENTLINEGTEVAEWSVWEVAQVNDPEMAELPLSRNPRFPEGYAILGTPPPGATTVTDTTVEMRRHAKAPYKLGSASSAGYTSMVKRGLKMIVSADYDARARYPDNGCAQEVYSNPDPLRYMELELLSPLRRIPPRGQLTMVTRWRIERAR